MTFSILSVLVAATAAAAVVASLMHWRSCASRRAARQSALLGSVARRLLNPHSAPGTHGQAEPDTATYAANLLRLGLVAAEEAPDGASTPASAPAGLNEVPVLRTEPPKAVESPDAVALLLDAAAVFGQTLRAGPVATEEIKAQTAEDLAACGLAIAETLPAGHPGREVLATECKLLVPTLVRAEPRAVPTLPRSGLATLGAAARWGRAAASLSPLATAVAASLGFVAAFAAVAERWDEAADANEALARGQAELRRTRDKLRTTEAESESLASQLKMTVAVLNGETASKSAAEANLRAERQTSEAREATLKRIDAAFRNAYPGEHDWLLAPLGGYDKAFNEAVTVGGTASQNLLASSATESERNLALEGLAFEAARAAHAYHLALRLAWPEQQEWDANARQLFDRTFKVEAAGPEPVTVTINLEGDPAVWAGPAREALKAALNPAPAGRAYAVAPEGALAVTVGDPLDLIPLIDRLGDLAKDASAAAAPDAPLLPAHVPGLEALRNQAVAEAKKRGTGLIRLASLRVAAPSPGPDAAPVAENP